MGLETINYIYSTPLNAKELLNSYGIFFHNFSDSKAVIQRPDSIIELDFETDSRLMIRVTLCNPIKPIFEELDNLFDYLLNQHMGRLRDLNTKREYSHYTTKDSEEIKSSYLKKKAIFKQLYGDYTAAIGSEEFYRRINRGG